MNNQELKEIEAMLVVIYQKIVELEYRVKGGSRMASIGTYADELRKEAQKLLKDGR